MKCSEMSNNERQLLLLSTQGNVNSATSGDVAPNQLLDSMKHAYSKLTCGIYSYSVLCFLTTGMSFSGFYMRLENFSTGTYSQSSFWGNTMIFLSVIIYGSVRFCCIRFTSALSDYTGRRSMFMVSLLFSVIAGKTPNDYCGHILTFLSSSNCGNLHDLGSCCFAFGCCLGSIGYSISRGTGLDQRCGGRALVMLARFLCIFRDFVDRWLDCWFYSRCRSYKYRGESYKLHLLFPLVDYETTFRAPVHVSWL